MHMYWIKSKYFLYIDWPSTHRGQHSPSIYFSTYPCNYKICILFLKMPCLIEPSIFLTSMLYVWFKSFTICGQSKYIIARTVDLTYRWTPARYFALLDPTPGRSVITGTPGTQVRLPHLRVLHNNQKVHGKYKEAPNYRTIANKDDRIINSNNNLW